jgi:Zn-finger nucleic acid-binding protein
MQVSDREAVEIKYCSQCGGIWLQRGALEGIIARVSRPSLPGQNRPKVEKQNDDDHGSHDENELPLGNGRQGQPSERERRSGGIREFLGELFDFG